MKRLIIILVVILVGILIFMQYKKHERYHPPQLYTYELQKGLDVHYHDQSALLSYYQTVHELNSLARNIWFNEGIDILFADNSNVESIEAVKHYDRLKAYADFLGEKLVESERLKNAGYNNSEIQTIEGTGQLPKDKEEKGYLDKQILKFGDRNIHVWELQFILRALGYEIPYDGLFGEGTFDALLKFQDKNELHPTGQTDKETRKELYKSKISLK